jgi:5-methylcytosine-specific restriction protein A
MMGKTYGDSLKNQGLEDLALWTAQNGHPAITGLIVDTTTLQPGDGYYRAFGKSEDFSWWESEIRKSIEYDWGRVTTRTANRQSSVPSAPQGYPDVSSYVTALRQLIATAPPTHIAMLRAHRQAVDQTVSATELARAAGYESFHAANLQYGIFANKVCDLLDFVPPIGNSGEPSPTHVLAAPYRRGPRAEWVWKMRTPVVTALDLIFLDEGGKSAIHPIHSEELPSGDEYVEGAALQVFVNQFERSREARQTCLDYWGARCGVCEMDFEEVYGLDGNRGIHVHHLLPLSQIRSEYKIDPINDLRPVCPNCHAALHSEDPPLSLDMLRRRYRERRKG